MFDFNLKIDLDIRKGGDMGMFITLVPKDLK